MMGASPMAWASQASPRPTESSSVSFVATESLTPTSTRARCGASARPTTTAPTRKAKASTTMIATSRALTVPLWTKPVTTARITRPSTSSMTAAPSTMRASGESRRFASRNTRPVMPTEVAQRVAPTKR